MKALQLSLIVFFAVSLLTGFTYYENLNLLGLRLHPIWNLIFIPLLIIIISKSKKSKKEDKIFMILWLIMCFFSGTARQIGFAPLFIHQIVVWPLLVYIPYQIYKSFLEKN